MKAENIIGPVSIVDRQARSYLGIRLQTPFNGMFALVTKALKEMRKWSKERSLADEGPYFVRYYHCDMKDIMDVEVGLLWPGRSGADPAGFTSEGKVRHPDLSRKRTARQSGPHEMGGRERGQV